VGKPDRSADILIGFPRVDTEPKGYFYSLVEAGTGQIFGELYRVTWRVERLLVVA
jgi:hypothetical protein